MVTVCEGASSAKHPELMAATLMTHANLLAFVRQPE